jgi:tetratricopeptide (TPR) repeat protein
MWRIYYAHLLMVLQRSDEALAQGQLAVDLDPLNPLILSLYAVVLRDAGNYQSAIQHIEKALSIDPNHWFALRHLADVSEDIGDYQRWFELWKKRPEWQSLDLLTIEKVFHEQGYLAAIEEIIQQCEEAAKEMHIPVPGQARRYLIVKKYDKAMDWLEMGYKNHHPGMSYISTNLSPTDQLKDNPRYIELLKKMNLPLPED